MPITQVKASPAFKAQARRAILAIVFFLVTYLVLLLLAVGMTMLCILGGFALIVIHPSLLTLVLGVGLASVGVFILIFLVKFIFKSTRVDRSHLQEIRREDEPALFQLIDEIVTKVGTRFPKKVYLATNVNASVFYDSNFWSMFLPIRKNLMIGMGLVNTITKDEFKAILAHEFGHFSQRTMKVGSYVYNVNQVIHNMLYDNESYDNLAQRWANVSWYFYLFVSLALAINRGIQWVLRKLYDLVNKSHMGLSREMEFHADEIAASITGYQPLKTSLLRLDMANTAYSQVLSFYDGKMPDNAISSNLYEEQAFVLGFLAEQSNMPTAHGLPQVTTEDLSRFNKSKLVIVDQWASHPSTEDRVARLEQTGFTNEDIDHAPANHLFTDPAKIQETLTSWIFDGVVYEGEVHPLPLASFREEYADSYRRDTFPKKYNGYYNHKNFTPFEHDEVMTDDGEHTFEQLYSDQKVDLVYTAIALRNDLATLDQIGHGFIDVKTFDYDGHKYATKQCWDLIPKLQDQVDDIMDEIELNDIDIYRFFLAQEQHLQVPPKLEQLYRDFFAFEASFDPRYEAYSDLATSLQFVQVVTPIEQIKQHMEDIKPLEVTLKERIHEFLNDAGNRVILTEEERDRFDTYTAKEWRYFDGENYENDALEVLYSAMNQYSALLSREYFLRKQEILRYQLELVAPVKEGVL
jgi:Zn-dependent protease with chaperone function